MNLKTHDWAAFWTMAIPCNDEFDRLHDECTKIDRLTISCHLIALHPSVPCTPAFNACMVGLLRHLVEAHGYTPTRLNKPMDVRTWRNVRTVQPGYRLVREWLSDNAPELRA